MGTNKTLEGHKLLILTWDPPSQFIDNMHQRFPGLRIVCRKFDEWSPRRIEDVPSDEWEDTTVLLTFRMLPKPEMAPKMQYVQIMSAGANHVLQTPLFLDTDVAFCTANGVHGPQISEWVISTFLAFQHHIPGYLDAQREGKWRRTGVPVDDAVGQRVGILGYGSIGRQVARVAKAMGMDVHAYTLHARDTPESRRDDGYSPPGLGDPDGAFPSRWFSGESKRELHEFLGSGLDLLVISMPLTDETRGLIGADEFAVLDAHNKTRHGTFVSNIARGAIVATDDLVEALNSGKIRGAALDVTDPEPLTDGHPLWTAKNVIITPHVSGNSTQYNTRVLAILEHNLVRLSEGRELTNKVSRKHGY